MRLPRDLSGRTLVNALCRDWDYRVVNQVGSHIICQCWVSSQNALFFIAIQADHQQPVDSVDFKGFAPFELAVDPDVGSAQLDRVHSV